MIHIGGGKYIIVEEGQLDIVPAPKGPSKPKRKRITPPAKHYREGLKAGLPDRRPGWIEWRRLVGVESFRAIPKGKLGRRPGLPNGMTKQMLKETKEKFIAMFDFDESLEDLVAAIKGRIRQEEDPIVRLSLREHVQIVLTDHPVNLKQQSLNKLLEYTKAKPVQKSEVAISNSHDTFADLLEEMSGKDECTKLN